VAGGKKREQSSAMPPVLSWSERILTADSLDAVLH
jgi:hypothetical protein